MGNQQNLSPRVAERVFEAVFLSFVRISYRLNWVNLRRGRHYGFEARCDIFSLILAHWTNVSLERRFGHRVLWVRGYMGCGTARGGRLPCKQDIQVGSIPTRSIGAVQS